MRFLVCLLPLVVLIGVSRWAGLGEIGALAQTSLPPSVTHVGVVVPDIDSAVRAYAELVGTQIPDIQRTEAHDSTGPVRAARIHLSNITIELLQPVGDVSNTYHDFVGTGGPGVHHLGLELDPDDQALSVNLTEQLGLTLEHGTGVLEPSPVTRPPLGRPTCITHIGIVVRNIKASRKALADLLKVDVPVIGEFNEPRGLAEYAVFNLKNTNIELLQQTGDGSGSYADFLATHGQRVHHVGLHLRRTNDSLSMQEQIAWLVQHGGGMALNTGGFAYVDFRPQLGLFVEALPRATNERVYPHPH